MIRGVRIWLDRISTSYGTQPTPTGRVWLGGTTVGKLICPLCSVATSPTPATFEAKVYRFIESRIGEIATTSEDGHVKAVTPYKPGEPIYGIIVCAACEKRFVAEETRDGWIARYPIQHKFAAKEIPEPMKSQFEEAQLCFDVGANRGCLLMCRTTLISLQRQQQVSNLRDLMDKGIISSLMYAQADQVRLWANMVGHEDIPEVIAREDSEPLLDDVYVKPDRLAALQERHEQMKKGASPSKTTTSSQSPITKPIR